MVICAALVGYECLLLYTATPEIGGSDGEMWESGCFLLKQLQLQALHSRLGVFHSLLSYQSILSVPL